MSSSPACDSSKIRAVTLPARCRFTRGFTTVITVEGTNPGRIARMRGRAAVARGKTSILSPIDPKARDTTMADKLLVEGR